LGGEVKFRDRVRVRVSIGVRVRASKLGGELLHQRPVKLGFTTVQIRK